MDELFDSNLKVQIAETHSDVKHILAELDKIDKRINNHDKRIRNLELVQQTLKVKIVLIVSTICAIATFLSHTILTKLGK